MPAGVDSAAGKLVYLALAGSDGADAEVLGRRLDMKRVEVYGILGTLESRGLVERADCGSYLAVG